MYDKVIITNKAALTAKYGGQGVVAVTKAVKSLIAADKVRGLITGLVYLDDATAMGRFGGSSVTTPTSPRQNKAAIDAIYSSIQPDYLMLLGAPDVIPHQDLENIAYSPGNDEDDAAWGDLPYACDAPYSTNPAHFVGPTRVVGRLPDLTGATDPAYLVSLLKVAATYKTLPAQPSSKYFGLTAKVWNGSTTQSLENIFGNAADMLVSPTAGPNYLNSELNALYHFINCHGAKASPEFYGQQGNTFPVALTTATAHGQIRGGCVGAAECCFGGELYDSVTLGLDMPLCQAYLAQGAYGFFGSTTIAYGPADGNGAADFICQDFLLNVLQGASLGHAVLRARQRFVERTGEMDPIDLKTLAQFCLLGDPSIHPVVPQNAAQVPATTDSAKAKRSVRAATRVKLKLMGEFLVQNKPIASKRVPTGKMTAATKKALTNIATKAGMPASQRFLAFSLSGKAAASAKKMKADSVPTRYFITVWKPEKKHKELNLGCAIAAKELNGRIVDYRIYRQR